MSSQASANKKGAKTMQICHYQYDDNCSPCEEYGDIKCEDCPYYWDEQFDEE